MRVVTSSSRSLSPASLAISILAPPRSPWPEKNQREIWGSCKPIRHILARVTVGLAIPALGSQVPGGTEETLPELRRRREGPALEAGALALGSLGLMGASASQAGLVSDLTSEIPGSLPVLSLASLPAPGPTSSHVMRSLHGGLAELDSLAFQAGDALIKSFPGCVVCMVLCSDPCLRWGFWWIGPPKPQATSATCLFHHRRVQEEV